jgi:hypothetical protein
MTEYSEQEQELSDLFAKLEAGWLANPPPEAALARPPIPLTRRPTDQVTIVALQTRAT